MKISVLTPDFSHNCLGRALVLAKVLQRRYDVEIVGPIFGEGIWPPLAGESEIAYKPVKLKGWWSPYWRILQLVNSIDGEIIYAQKPLFSSYVVGLLKKIGGRKPLILDIDDGQTGLIKERLNQLSFFRRVRRLIASTLFLYKNDSYWNALAGEKLTRFADEITVSNRVLQGVFGGTVVWHGRDTDYFDPGQHDPSRLREEYRVGEDKKIVMFFGTPRAHKGVEDLIRAMELLDNRKVILMIVGLDSGDAYCSELRDTAIKRLGEERFIDLGLQPFEKVPEILSMADILVVPQRKNEATLAQLPAKLFDAMAMERPIVATDVSDISYVLNGCGWIVEPGNPEGLAGAIQDVLSNPEESRERGRKARQRCIENFSWNALEEVLFRVFRKYE